MSHLKPLLKWVGGKSQLLKDIFTLFPKKINNYYEPFIGGASVLLELLNKIENNEIIVNGKIYAYDNNANLIYFYNTIKNNHLLFIEQIKLLKEDYEKCSNTKINAKKIVYPIPKENTIQSKELFFYYIRQEYNKLINHNEKNDTHILMISVYLLFLNKTCFRGLYRMGPNGFNVPYGNYKNPSIFDENEINQISTLFNKYNVTFTYQSFEKVFDYKFKKTDFIYFDPPYVPENSTSFVTYNEDGFNEEKHKNLFENIKKLNCAFILSNSDTKLLYDYFENSNYNIHKIKAKRAIKSNDPTATTNELLIYSTI
jgi:DNA adenine methylase